ncbi:hypothetical protein C0585_04310 [Candidatus Woesearchaeota archaeon]|nr:MAG: hypothetical protein C0585_04310 [Candidatus Woesearchaeota archaeon]
MSKTQKIFCFGNPYIKEDSLAIELADELKIKGFEFVKAYSPDFLMDYSGDLFILDVAKGISKVEVVEDTSFLSSNEMLSLHDFDLQFFLKLLDELGNLGKVKIFAIPLDYDKEKAKFELKKLIS